MSKKVYWLFFIYFTCIHPIFSQQPVTPENEVPALQRTGAVRVDPREQKAWTDSVFNSLTETQRLGQLFNIAAYSNMGEDHYQKLLRLIKTYNIGGLTFFQGGPVRQAELTNRYQAAAPTPLLIGMDAEWGLGMRLDSTVSFPRQLTLGAIQNEQTVYDMGAEIARQFEIMGMHLNFAPVIDINSNPANPVIGNRSFGENKYKVAAKGIAYMHGLQDHGVIACAKHFPGHGDTGTDSHYSLPVINHTRERLNDMELFPFRKLIENDLMSTMIGHIHIPVYDNTPNKAVTLSKSLVTGLLKEEMKFEGLIFTDALNMKGVSKYYKPGELEVMALEAGNDVLLLSEDVPEAIKRIKEAIENGRLNRKDINRRVKKILAAKYWAGLNHYEPVNTTNLVERLNSPDAQLVKQKLYEDAVTVVRNEGNLMPVTMLDTANFASLSIGTEGTGEFQQGLSKYTAFSHYQISGDYTSETMYDDMFNRLKRYDIVVVGMHNLNNSRYRNYGVEKEQIAFLKALEEETKVIVVVFGNPYSLRSFEDFPHLICAYEDEELARRVVPQAIFGAIEASGRLPVTASLTFREGTGETTRPIGRLAYSIPEDVSMNSFVLNEIDQIAKEAIRDHATPSVQVLVARNGKVVFDRSYGHYTYDSLRKVDNQTLYDIASVTKVSATLQAIMFLEGRGLIDLDETIGTYLPELKGTNKEDLVIRDILLHQSGLIAYIPFWRRTVNEFGVMSDYYSHYPMENFQYQVAANLYGLNSMQDSLWRWAIESDLRWKKNKRRPYDYKYSDIGFYIMKHLAETLLNQPMEIFLEQNFYDPMGLNTLTYLPLCNFSVDRIAPTEKDTYFRNSLVCGIVNDQGAAMLGGIAGHAGLFSNANDLAILMQMNLQGGHYGGVNYFLPGTVERFTRRYDKDNRRGLGWDKPSPDGEDWPTSRYASQRTFGHTGFTGTAVWADPEYDLIYIFLSNRTYPDSRNNKLFEKNIRTRIQDVIYRSMKDLEDYNDQVLIIN